VLCCGVVDKVEAYCMVKGGPGSTPSDSTCSFQLLNAGGGSGDGWQAGTRGEGQARREGTKSF